MSELKQVSLNEFLDGWIAIMKRVVKQDRPFHLPAWQKPFEREDERGQVHSSIATTERQLKSCGSPACGGGHLAVSAFWKGLGGKVSSISGTPLYGLLTGSSAIANAIYNGRKSITGHYIEELVCGSINIFGMKANKDITAQQFLDALVRYRETGSPYLENSDIEA